MKVVHLGHDSVHIGNRRQINEPYFDDAYWMNELRIVDIHMLRRKPLYREAIETHSSSKGLKGKVLLDSDGNSNSPDWMYLDEKKRRKVQDWIDKIDGRYAVAFLAICNEGNRSKIHSEKTAIVHPRTSTSYVKMMGGSGIIAGVFIPGVGYLPDNSRELRKVIDSRIKP